MLEPAGCGGRCSPAASTSSSPSRSESATRRRIAVRSSTTWSSAATIAPAFSVQMSGQMPGCPAATRVMSRKPPAASRRRAAFSSAPFDAAFISVAATRCGTCETTATSRSWSAGASATTSAPSALMVVWQAGERVQVGRRGRRQHPRRPGEQVRVGAVEADLLGAGHRVPADEPRVVDRGDDRRLDAGDVRDDEVWSPGRVVEQAPGDRGDRAGRRGDERDCRGRVVTDLVDRAGRPARPALGRRPRRRRSRASRGPAAPGRVSRRSARSRRRAPYSGRSSRSTCAPWR